MQVTLLAIGTWGDVHPVVALGAALQGTGRHTARLVAPDDFAALAQGAGLDFRPLGLRVRDLLRSPALRPFIAPGGSLLAGMRDLLRLLRPMLDRLMASTWEACQGAEAIVYSSLGLGAYHAAERLGVPAFWTMPFPNGRTRAFPSVAFPALPLGGAYNALTHALGERLLQTLTAGFFDRWRRECLGLPALPRGFWPYETLHGRPVPRLFSFSRLVFPKPPDWAEHFHLTGYWFLDPPADWAPPAGLEDFLESGPRPVYVGFGSVPHTNPEQTTRLVIEALRRSGRRGVIATGWGGLARGGAAGLGDDVFAVDTIPHAWLFPRVAAVVHHGGSGTTGAGLGAGVPAVLVPHAGDQPLWARRLARLGVSAAPIPFRRLTRSGAGVRHWASRHRSGDTGPRCGVGRAYSRGGGCGAGRDHHRALP